MESINQGGKDFALKLIHFLVQSCKLILNDLSVRNDLTPFALQTRKPKRLVKMMCATPSFGRYASSTEEFQPVNAP